MFLSVDDQQIKVNIERQRRRSLTIQVKDGQLFIKAPLLMSNETIIGFLDKKKRWIKNRITNNTLPEIDLESRYYFSFGIKTEIDEDSKKVVLDPAYLYQRLTFWQNHLNLYPKKVSVKKMKRSWGRCSSTGTITLNIRLLHYDKRFIDAVIVHELFHLNHMNHSRSFKEALIEALPEYKVWIKLNRLE